MRTKGLSQIEIARELHVSEASISSDMQYLREQARESIKHYATNQLPEQYQIALAALDEVIKSAFYIYAKSEEYREKLQAMTLFKDTHMVKLELLSNATTIDNALHYIKSKQQEQKEDQGLALDSTTSNGDDSKQMVF